MSDFTLENVRFDENGLIPAIVQDANSGDVLMLAYMNEEALRKTQQTGRTHFWSRSRGRLWRKGESSGHEQIVTGIRINCEQNSLLVEAIQTGAVCHDGYPTCYYRSLGSDGSLRTVRERVFDPALVYSALPEKYAASDPTSVQFAAYEYLRDHDLSDQSRTSRRLRTSGENVRGRIADELRELAGVISGDHRHDDLTSDVQLEASQVIYWLLVYLIGRGHIWDDLRPDRALTPPDDILSPETISRLLAAQADLWSGVQDSALDVVAQVHATLALVAQACCATGVHPLDPVRTDLDELRSRPYLAPFFSGVGQAANVNESEHGAN